MDGKYLFHSRVSSQIEPVKKPLQAKISKTNSFMCNTQQNSPSRSLVSVNLCVSSMYHIKHFGLGLKSCACLICTTFPCYILINAHWCTFSCIPGMRCTWLVYYIIMVYFGHENIILHWCMYNMCISHCLCTQLKKTRMEHFLKMTNYVSKRNL